MFYNPFRKIRELEDTLHLREVLIKGLRAQIDDLQKGRAENIIPQVSCAGCKHLICMADQENGRDIREYHCRLVSHHKNQKCPSFEWLEKKI